MPSASSKSEKPASTEATDPLKQAIVIIEHKIRNLEKRKSKLDSYRESNKTLDKEQYEAISKYDEVVQQLELSKEFVKQFTLIDTENSKLKKRQARKDALERYLSEVNKVKQVLLIQDILQCMGTESVREDFLAGRNGAVKLTQDDLKALDDLYLEVSPKRGSEDETAVQADQFQKAADYYMAIIEGKAKKIAGLTAIKLKELITSIFTSGYFDKPAAVEETAESSETKPENETAAEEEEEFHENQEILSNVIVPTQNPPDGNLAPPAPNPAPVQPIMPGPVIPGNAPPVMPPNQQPIMGNVPTIVPTPVSQVESSFFNAQGFKPPAPPSVVPPPSQNARQINDVIQSVTGKFNFLQESELDLAEMNSVMPGNPPVPPPQIPGGPPSTIPTQTFTNQNFNGQPGNAPNFPPNFPPQPAAFQAFVPAFPAFVTPNATPVQNTNSNNNNSANPSAVAPVNSVNPNIPNNSSNIHSNTNKSNNIPNSIPLTATRNPNVSFNQGQQQLPPGFPNQPDPANMSQPSNQPVFQHGNVPATVNNVNNETVRKENEMKEKQEKEKQEWSQPERTNWADDCAEPSEWNPSNQNQSEGPSSGNKFSSGRPNRNMSGAPPRNSNGYQGNRPRTHRQGDYRDSQTGNNGRGSSNYYQNQNGYQSRSEYSVGGKGNSELRDGSFKERGDFGSRDREPRDNFGGGFKRGPPNRGPNVKGPMDRGDRQGQIQRNNPGGPRGPRNVNRQPNGRNGSSFQRQQPNTVGQAPIQ